MMFISVFHLMMWLLSISFFLTPVFVGATLLNVMIWMNV